jgi:hypothetical protein
MHWALQEFITLGLIYCFSPATVLPSIHERSTRCLTSPFQEDQMTRLPAWLPSLLERINWGCSTSPLLLQLSNDDKVLSIGRETCADLWPFIRDLAGNIGIVRDMLPKDMTSAAKLLSQLADDERHYQQLFVDQCLLAGLTQEELSGLQPTATSNRLCEVMNNYCRKTYTDGIYAIVAAELAAASFARIALPNYERYFASHSENHAPSKVEHGLSWLRLHAKQHTRHALWLRRMLNEIKADTSTESPEPVEHVVEAVLQLWHCPPMAANSPPPAKHETLR